MVQVALYDREVELLHKAQYRSLVEFFEMAMRYLESDLLRQIALVQVQVLDESDEQ
jgi:hypothetical protein